MKLIKFIIINCAILTLCIAVNASNSDGTVDSPEHPPICGN